MIFDGKGDTQRKLGKMGDDGTPRVASFHDLPTPLKLIILSHLKFVDRVQLSLVEKRWKAFMDDEPAFWAELEFEGSRAEHLNDSVLLGIVRRSAGQLRSLDLSAKACKDITLKLDGQPLLSVMAAEGLTSGLQRLSAPPGFLLKNPGAARQLRAACPSLQRADVFQRGPWRAALPALHALSGVRLGTASIFCTLPTQDGATGFAAFAAALPAALAACRVDSLDFFSCGPTGWWAHGAENEEDLEVELATSESWEATFRRCFLRDPDAANAAAARVAEALTSPLTGPRELACSTPWDVTAPPFFADVLRSLTPASPLRALYLQAVCDGRESDPEELLFDTEQLPAALQPGRSRIETLVINGSGVLGQGPAGYEALVSALEANETVTDLTLQGARGPAAPLARLLRRNATLRHLTLQVFHGDRRAFETVLEALAPVSAAEAAAEAAASAEAGGGAEGAGGATVEGRCALESLELHGALHTAAAAALAHSLRRGARLRRFTAAGCPLTSVIPRGGVQAAVIEGEEGLGALEAIAGFLEELSIANISIGDAGAEAIARALRAPSCPLTALRLQGNCGLEDPGVVAIAQALQDAAATSRIHTLHLAQGEPPHVFLRPNRTPGETAAAALEAAAEVWRAARGHASDGAVDAAAPLREAAREIRRASLGGGGGAGEATPMT